MTKRKRTTGPSAKVSKSRHNATNAITSGDSNAIASGDSNAMAATATATHGSAKMEESTTQESATAETTATSCSCTSTSTCSHQSYPMESTVKSIEDKRTEEWLQKYQELKLFKEKAGHCRVPRSSLHGEAIRCLGNWVHYQRSKYMSKVLSADKKALLDKIGFEWKLRHRAPPFNGKVTSVKRDKEFMRNVAKLEHFKSIFGDCRVPPPYREDPALGNWVHNLRKRRKSCNLSDERLAVLDKIGFVWDASNGKGLSEK